MFYNTKDLYSNITELMTTLNSNKKGLNIGLIPKNSDFLLMVESIFKYMSMTKNNKTLFVYKGGYSDLNHMTFYNTKNFPNIANNVMDVITCIKNNSIENYDKVIFSRCKFDTDDLMKIQKVYGDKCLIILEDDKELYNSYKQLLKPEQQVENKGWINSKTDKIDTNTYLIKINAASLNKENCFLTVNNGEIKLTVKTKTIFFEPGEYTVYTNLSPNMEIKETKLQDGVIELKIQSNIDENKVIYF